MYLDNQQEEEDEYKTLNVHIPKEYDLFLNQVKILTDRTKRSCYQSAIELLQQQDNSYFNELDDSETELLSKPTGEYVKRKTKISSTQKQFLNQLGSLTPIGKSEATTLALSLFFEKQGLEDYLENAKKQVDQEEKPL